MRKPWSFPGSRWMPVPRPLPGVCWLVLTQLCSCIQHSDFYCTHKDLHASLLNTFLLLTELYLSQALIWPLGTV